MNAQDVKNILKTLGIRPRKEQGQNFLIDDSVIRDSIKAANVTADDTVLEIGPGLGVLTLELAAHAKQVIAIEQDLVMAAALTKISQQHQTHGAITVVPQDVRLVNLTELGLTHNNYKLVANLPYSITSWVIRHFLDTEVAPTSITVLVQLEVAQRMSAQPGQMSVLAIATQLYAEPTIVRTVSHESFEPQPKVESAIIHLQRREQPLSPEPEELMRLVNIGFSAKRKQLQNNLSAGFHMPSSEAKSALVQAGISETARPQELSIAQWESLRMVLPPHK